MAGRARRIGYANVINARLLLFRIILFADWIFVCYYCVYYIIDMQDNQTSPLFAFDASSWALEPEAAFDAYLTEYRFDGRRLRSSSFIIYRGMFTRLREWAVGQGVDWMALRATEVEHFLVSRSLSLETRHRYLLFFTALFERLAILRAPSGDSVPESDNPARSLLLQQRAPTRADPAFLNEMEVQQFIAALPQGDKWKTVRDRALALMVLGAGLRSAEVLSMKVSDVHCTEGVPDTVWVQAQAPRLARKVPIHSWAAPAIGQWLELRKIYARGDAPRYRGKEQRLSGSLLFPGGLSGGPLRAITLFRLIKATLDAAGLQKRYEGPTLLRNSCGALWLKQHDAQSVRLWMGHETLRTTELLLPASQRSQQGAGKGK